jgi:alpha-L-fucosidase
MNAGATTKRDRIAWWREARFGMFIHWGLYAIPAGVWKGKRVKGIGEQIQRFAKIPVRDYETLAKQFNPLGFDARAWVTLAKDAGMKYMVITAKHHDGFAMYHSRADRFNIVDATPYGRDIMSDL